MLSSATKQQAIENEFERDSDGSEVERLLMTNYIEAPILPEDIQITQASEYDSN